MCIPPAEHTHQPAFHLPILRAHSCDHGRGITIPAKIRQIPVPEGSNLPCHFRVRHHHGIAHPRPVAHGGPQGATITLTMADPSNWAPSQAWYVKLSGPTAPGRGV